MRLHSGLTLNRLIGSLQIPDSHPGHLLLRCNTNTPHLIRFWQNHPPRPPYRRSPPIIHPNLAPRPYTPSAPLRARPDALLAAPPAHSHCAPASPRWCRLARARQRIPTPRGDERVGGGGHGVRGRVCEQGKGRGGYRGRLCE